MQKICFVISDDNYLISHRSSLIAELNRANKSITVATKITDFSLKEKIEKLGCNIFDLKVRASKIGLIKNVKLLFLLIYHFNNSDSDIVAAYSIRMVFLSLIAFKFSRAKKFVGTITGFGNLETSRKTSVKLIKKVVLKILKLLLAAKNTTIIVQNRDDYQFVKANLIDPERTALILGSGVDINSYKPQPEPISDTIVVTVVSRMLKDKGILESVAAIKILYDAGLNVCLQLVGDVFLENPASLSALEMKKISELPFVHWLGFRKDINEVWENSHIALLASYREGLPKCLLEAASCGRPIVTTDVPGCSEVVKHGVNGYLVPAKSSQGISDAIIKLIDDKNLRLKMGNESRKMVEQHFADKIINKQTIDFFQGTRYFCLSDNELSRGNQ